MAKTFYSTRQPLPDHRFQKARAAVLSKLRRPDFPCIFSRKAALNQSIMWSCFDFNAGDIDEFIVIIDAYTRFVKRTPVVKRLLSPLIIIIRNTNISPNQLAKQQKFAWQLIQSLINHQPLINTSLSFADPQWALRFNDVELFINASLPGYKRMLSRSLCKQICFVVNPRAVFDIVAPAKTTQGQKVRDTIRKRVSNYNPLGTCPASLGGFGDAGNVEWQQYVVEDDGTLLNTCPLNKEKVRD